MVKNTTRLSLLFLLFFGINFKTFAQPGNLPSPYCMPLYAQSPCMQPGPSNMPGNFVNDFIHSVITFSGNLNINNINSGCNAQNFPSIGFRNYIYHKCVHNLSANAGQVVSFSVQVGNIFAQGVAIYIDWNNDNVFGNPTEQVAASAGTIPAGGWGTFTVTIPPAQPNGTYRMRVRCAAAVNGTSIDPCISYSGGETEDYDVYIGTTSPALSNVIASSNSTVCAGKTLSLNLTYTSQCTPSYTWVGPSGFFSNAQNPNIFNAQLPNSGNYTLTVTCGTACPVVVTTSVTIAPAPSISVSSSSSAVCSGSNSTITASGGSTYTWTGTTFTGSVIQPTLVQPAGTFTVTGAWATNACTNSTVITITALPSPTISAIANPTLLCSGNQATLTVSGGVNYTWTPSGSGSVSVVNPTITTTYSISGIGSNSCIGTTTITQNVSPCTNVIDHSPLDGIRVYPNPAGDILNFVVKDKSNIKMYDVNGKLIMQRLVKDRDKVDVSELSKGIYLLYFDKETEPVKIIKE